MMMLLGETNYLQISQLRCGLESENARLADALAAHDAYAAGLAMVRHFEVADASIRQKKPV